jgi:4,5-DOPA dioxygenase extradiol
MKHDLNKFNRFTDSLKEQGSMMPVLFIGHGSPMNGIEDNEFSAYWKQLATEIPLPKAIIVVSAHWLTKGTAITAMDFPETIHDFGGFPKELFQVNYPAPGSPVLARETAELLGPDRIHLNHEWGLDHGSWTILRHMYPDNNIPILQLSIDATRSPQYHYELAGELHALRKKGVLIIGSGNMVHNLRMVAWDKLNDPGFGYDWAVSMNEKFKQLIADGNHKELIQFDRLGPEARLAIPTAEHYLPLLYTLGLTTSRDEISFFNDRTVGGSLTMTSVQFNPR